MANQCWNLLILWRLPEYILDVGTPYSLTKLAGVVTEKYETHGHDGNFVVIGGSEGCQATSGASSDDKVATLQRRHYGRGGVPNHQPHDCLLNRFFRRRSKKTPKPHFTGLCAGNSPVTGEFPAQSASNAENVSIWWRHHASWHFSAFSGISLCDFPSMWIDRARDSLWYDTPTLPWSVT